MKECKIIHIQADEEQFPAGDFVWAERRLEVYLNIGYELLQMIPDYAPATGSGRPDGFTVLLVRQRDEDEMDTEDVKDIYDYVDDMLAGFDTEPDGAEVGAEEALLREDAPADTGERPEVFYHGLSEGLEQFMDENGELPFH